MPFAGHPNVGTALVLAERAAEPPDAMLFEEDAGLVPIRLAREGGRLTATLDAPQPLRLGAGLGLGLSISANIVRDFGGTIACRDAAPGAEFCVRLPMARAA